MENIEMNPAGLPLDSSTFAKPEVQVLKLLKGITKVLTNTAIKNYQRVPDAIIDTVFDSIKREDNPGMIGWKLISRSLVNALLQLISEFDYRLKKEDIETEPLDKKLNEYLENKEYFIGIDFFNNPKSLPLINNIKPILKEYLGYFDFEEYEISNILNRFDSYFILALREEWSNNEKLYSSLKGIINTPFDPAVKKEVEWNNYFIELEKEILKPVFSESFSLKQIYIPLRACYKEKKRIDSRIDNERDKKEKEIVIDIESYLSNWIQKGDKEDHTRIIHGGPGLGKSSFLKLFAAKLAEQRQKVIFIPLHRCKISERLNQTINGFLTEETQSFSSDIITNDEKDKIILLFDGLDELSMQGKMLTEIAQNFLHEIARSVSNFNQRNCRFQIIITGRDVVVQQNEGDFKNEGQVLRLLPYYLTDEDKDIKEYIDKDNLLKIDQRDVWWTKYGQISRENYSGLPQKLKTREIDEITAQPLLNYLVALSYQRGKINFSPKTNLNEIYSDLLEAVFQRKYSGEQKNNTVGKMDLEDFCLIFEEIALCAWHSEGRTTTVAKINSHFQDSDLTCQLKSFIADADQGVISLLAAFYFRHAGHSEKGSQTFEFTHKSFCEYLTAKKIVRQLKTIHERLVKKEKTPELCLVEWIQVFGVKTLDFDLIKFISNELKLVGKMNFSLLISWQKTVVKLLEYVLNKGMPIEKLEKRNTFKEENKQAMNSEKALLVIHSVIAEITNIVSKVEWPDKEISFGEFIGRLSGQRKEDNVFILKFCNHLDLSTSILHVKDLYKSNFQLSNLRYCDLTLASLEGADLREADLREANLKGAHLKKAHLEKAHLEKTYLRGANLEGAYLREANLREANLENANLENANLASAHLERANLKRANLRYANLRYANLTGANIEEVNLKEANLQNANLEETNLEETKRLIQDQKQLFLNL
ncbi:MAG: pentapeptide repeat-containing protein [Candidatus Symbiothrix sp.]|jgi:uncharacterized protein YjbI with pentapeptide repeats|nr:pentapeptide repeat-containing protein [Candidatus Symbiothrix sp.]